MKKTQKRGLTLLELLVGVGIVGVMAAMLLFGLSRCQGGESNKGQAEQAGREYLQGLGYKVLGVVCTEYDSDGDSYVSCTGRVEGAAEPLAIECASDWRMQRGCRLQKPGTGQRVR